MNSIAAFDTFSYEMLQRFSMYPCAVPGISKHKVNLQTDKLAIFNVSFSVDIGNEGLPLLTLKSTPWRAAIAEMQWFISDSYRVSDLGPAEKWWQPWTGSLQYVTDLLLPYKLHSYSYKRILNALQNQQPGSFDSTHLVANIWPPEQHLSKALLPPCAFGYQILVADGKLNLTVQQRSADLLLGLACNVAQYSWLLCRYAEAAGLAQGNLTFNIGNLHVYKSQMQTANWQMLLERRPQATIKRWFLSGHLSDWQELELTRPYKSQGFLGFPLAAVHTPGYESVY